MQPKLIITFEILSESDFLAKAESISSALATNASFPTPWPSPLTAPLSLTTLFATYQTAFNNALTHDASKVVLRDTARAALTTYLKKLGLYLEVVANGDIAKLLTTGFSLRNDRAPSGGTDPLPAPEEFDVKRGELSGVLVAHAKKLKGAASYVVQITEGDPLVAANWREFAVLKNCNKIVIEGQVPGHTVWVRLRAIGSNGPGVWTDPASAMVV